MKSTAFRILVSLFVLSGCLEGDSGGGGGSSSSGGTISGGTGAPPGEKGTEASSLKENPLSAICQTLAGDYYLASNGGKILASGDGATYTVLDSAKYDLRGAHCDRQSTAANVWFVGAGGNILYYNGALAAQASGTTATLNAVFGNNTVDVFAVGDSGTIVHLDASGNWSVQNSTTTKDLRGVGGKLGEMLAVGADGTVLKSLNSGTTWTAESLSPVALASGTRLNAVWMNPGTGNNEAFVVGNAGTILHRDAAGVWERQAVDATALELLGVDGSDGNNLFAVGEEGTVLVYNGLGWTLVTMPAGAEDFRLTDVLVFSGTQALVTGADGTSATSTGLLLEYTGSGWVQVL